MCNGPEGKNNWWERKAKEEASGYDNELAMRDLWERWFSNRTRHRSPIARGCRISWCYSSRERTGGLFTYASALKGINWESTLRRKHDQKNTFLAQQDWVAWLKEYLNSHSSLTGQHKTQGNWVPSITHKNTFARILYVLWHKFQSCKWKRMKLTPPPSFMAGAGLAGLTWSKATQGVICEAPGRLPSLKLSS